MDKKFVNAIALNGGGVLGTVTAIFLARLHEKGLVDLDNTYFGATSAGSILAAAICKPNPLSPREAVELSSEIATYVFGTKKISFLPNWMSTAIFSHPYSGKKLADILRHHLGGDQVKLGDCPRKLVVTVWDAAGCSNGHRASGPMFVHNHKPYHKERLEWPLWRIVCGSSSAPTYFPPHLWADGKHGYNWVDGGICDNTGALGLFSVLRDQYRSDKEGGVPINKLSLLSIGNGSKPFVEKHVPKGWATPNTVRRISKSIVQGGEELSRRILEGVCHSNFHRMNPRIYGTEVGLDEYKKIPDLVNFAENVDISETESWRRGLTKN